MKVQKSKTASGAGGGRRGFKNNMIVYAGLIEYMLCLGIRIPLLGVIGDAGVGLFAPAFEVITLITLLFSYGISRPMIGLMRYRVKRQQYKGADRIFQTAFRLALLLSLFLAALLALTSHLFAESIVLEEMSEKAILAAAPAILLTALVSVFRGYFNGIGLGGLAVQSQYIEKISMFITSTFGAGILYDYGLKVAGLLQNSIVAYAYGALGAVLGMIAAELITLIYLLIVFAISSVSWRKRLKQDAGRRIESSSEITTMLFGNGFTAALAVVLANLFMLIDYRFFNYCMNRKEMSNSRAALWGAYYGKFAVLIGIGSALGCLAVCGLIGKIGNAYEKEEYQIMYDRIGLAAKKLCVATFPIAIYLAVLAQAFINGLFQGNNETAISMLKRGTVIIFFYGTAFLFGQLLMKLRMMKELLISLGIALAVHLLAVFLLVRKGLQGEAGIVYSVIAFTAVLAVLCFAFIVKKLKYRQEWLYSIAFPAVSACVSGLVVMLINRLLLQSVGNILTIFISILVGVILYILMLMILRVLNEEELSRMFFGSLWISLGRMIGVL